MAKVFIEESTLSAIGDAIREKEGSTALVPVNDMASRIRRLAETDLSIDINAILEFLADNNVTSIEPEHTTGHGTHTRLYIGFDIDMYSSIPPFVKTLTAQTLRIGGYKLNEVCRLDYAFEGNTHIVDLTVEVAGFYSATQAFDRCTSLKYIDIDNVTCSMDFSQCPIDYSSALAFVRNLSYPNYGNEIYFGDIYSSSQKSTIQSNAPSEWRIYFV